jgi:predicted nuclease with TOPRIM domain
MAELEQIQQRIANVEADVSQAKEQLKAATGEERVALQQRLAALEQQKLLLMQQQSGATGLGSQPGCWHPRGQPSTL